MLPGQRDVASGDALRKLVQPLHALQDVVFDPLRAVDAVVDNLRRNLHLSLISDPELKFPTILEQSLGTVRRIGPVVATRATQWRTASSDARNPAGSER